MCAQGTKEDAFAASLGMKVQHLPLAEWKGPSGWNPKFGQFTMLMGELAMLKCAGHRDPPDALARLLSGCWKFEPCWGFSERKRPSRLSRHRLFRSCYRKSRCKPGGTRSPPRLQGTAIRVDLRGGRPHPGWHIAHCHMSSRETRRRRTRVPPVKVVPKWTLEMYGRSAGGASYPGTGLARAGLSGFLDHPL
jgi:hypothetical protein